MSHGCAPSHYCKRIILQRGSSIRLFFYYVIIRTMMNKVRELRAVLTREANTFLLSFVFGVVCLGGMLR